VLYRGIIRAKVEALERRLSVREIGRIRQHEKSGHEPSSRYDVQIFVTYFKIGVKKRSSSGLRG
jgi:hypothetical protein